MIGFHDAGRDYHNTGRYRADEKHRRGTGVEGGVAKRKPWIAPVSRKSITLTPLILTPLIRAPHDYKAAGKNKNENREHYSNIEKVYFIPMQNKSYDLRKCKHRPQTRTEL